jgi:hypothetical protein
MCVQIATCTRRRVSRACCTRYAPACACACVCVYVLPPNVPMAYPRTAVRLRPRVQTWKTHHVPVELEGYVLSWRVQVRAAPIAPQSLRCTSLMSKCEKAVPTDST